MLRSFNSVALTSMPSSFLLAGADCWVEWRSPLKRCPQTQKCLAQNHLERMTLRAHFPLASSSCTLLGNPNTIADGLLTTLCPRTLKAIKANVDGIITVSEKEIAAAMRLVYDRLKTVIEPSAATGVAVVLAKHRELMGCRKVVVLLCGGNVELDRFPHYLALAKL